MGNRSARLLKDEDEKGKKQGPSSSDDMLTPPPIIKGDGDITALIDPRSPTIGVSRTPLEVAAERERLRLKKLQIPGTTVNGQVPEGVLTPSAFRDPRSPTFEYKRTPVVPGAGAGNTNPYLTDDDSFTGGEQQEKNRKQGSVDSPTTVGGVAAPHDLRKRLFISQLNDSLTAAGLGEDKEN